MTVLFWLLVLSAPVRAVHVRYDRLKVFYSGSTWRGAAL